MNIVIPSEKSSQATQTNMLLLMYSALNGWKKKMRVVTPEQFVWLYAWSTKSQMPHAHWRTTCVRIAMARISRCLLWARSMRRLCRPVMVSTASLIMRSWSSS